MDIYVLARKHGISDTAIEHEVAEGDQEDGKVLYLGPDRAGNLLEIVAVRRDQGSEVVIHAMRMRASTSRSSMRWEEADG